jgi:formylglycine-generating enzyme required for sulfatase activity
VVRHGIKVIPGVGRAAEVIDDVLDRREQAKRHTEVMESVAGLSGAMSSVERKIAEVVRAEMQASFDQLRQANLPPPALEQAVRNLQDIRTYGRHEVFTAEALFANSSYYELFKKAPQEWGDVLADNDPFTADGFYVFFDGTDKKRLVKLKPMMLRMLLADQRRGAPETTVIGTQDLFAERVPVPALVAVAAPPASLPSGRAMVGGGATSASVLPPRLAEVHGRAVALPSNAADGQLIEGYKRIAAATKLANSLGMKFVEIKPGEFLTGSPTTDANHQPNETQHTVALTKGFLMAMNDVTRGQFAAFVADSGYRTDAETAGKAWSWNNGKPAEVNGANWRNPGYDQTDDHPVVDVSWNDAKAFCAWLRKKEGKNYRLPTEAEWEYSCRAGTTTAYPWGDNPEGGKGCANVGDLQLKQRLGNTGAWTGFNFDDGYVFTSSVGSFRPNAWGLHDMIGNVSQWCEDGYGDYPQDRTVDPTGVPNSTSRVLRGGSWYGLPMDCRCACRGRFTPVYRDGGIGFRVCLDF